MLLERMFVSSAGRCRKATITLCDLSSRFFCIDATLCVNLKAIRYELTCFNRIVVDKSHRVIAA